MAKDYAPDGAYYKLTAAFYSRKQQEEWADELPVRYYDHEKLLRWVDKNQGYYEDEAEWIPVRTPERVVLYSEVIDSLEQVVRYVMSHTSPKRIEVKSLMPPNQVHVRVRVEVQQEPRPFDDCTDMRCSRINGKCVGMHCARCGEPCSSMGHTKCKETNDD